MSPTVLETGNRVPVPLAPPTNKSPCAVNGLSASNAGALVVCPVPPLAKATAPLTAVVVPLRSTPLYCKPIVSVESACRICVSVPTPKAALLDPLCEDN